MDKIHNRYNFEMKNVLMYSSPMVLFNYYECEIFKSADTLVCWFKNYVSYLMFLLVMEGLMFSLITTKVFTFCKNDKNCHQVWTAEPKELDIFLTLKRLIPGVMFDCQRVTISLILMAWNEMHLFNTVIFREWFCKFILAC